MPGVGAYLVLPALSAAMAASLMNSGVSKSGSPAAKLATSSPAASMAFAFASIASVGDGAMFWAQTESGCGVLMSSRQIRRRRIQTQARGPDRRVLTRYAQFVRAQRRRGARRL